jgi:putative ABC transport system permease protein
MLRTYLLLTLRTFQKNKSAFIINLLGMSIALGCCIAAYVNYEFNAGFDELQQGAKDIYRVSFIHESENRETPYGVTPMPMPELIRSNNAEVEQVIRYISKSSMFRIGDEMFQTEFVYTDPNFMTVFRMDMLYGEANLNDPSRILISDKLAKTYFDSENVIGKPLTQIISGEPKEFLISGVYRAFPSNSSFRFGLITAFDNYFTDATSKDVVLNDWKKWTTTFVQVKDAAAIPRIEAQLKQYIKPQNEAREDLQARNFYLESFHGMALRAVKARAQGHWFNMPMPPAAMIAPFMMAGFLLLVACFNFTNNAIAIAGKRLKEIGIRKVIGGRRKELIIQFLSESFIFCILAGALSLVLAEFFVAGWDAMWPGIELSVRYRDNLDFLITLFLFLLLCFTALLAGAYPAFYISSFKPIAVLKGTTRFGGNTILTKSLLVFQFSISLAAVIFAIAFYFNSRFQKEFDLGYDYRAVVQVPVQNESQYTQLSNVLQRLPEIASIGGSEHHIYSSSYKAPAKVREEKKEIDVLNVGDGYFNTVNVRVLEGRAFLPESASDLKEGIIVNEEFARFFKLDKAVGSRVTLSDTSNFYVIGVVKDVYLKALFQPLAPIAFRYTGKDNYRYLVASADNGDVSALNEQIRTEWKKLFPTILYTGRLMEQEMVMTMEHFDNVVILYTFLGLVAIIMSASGLYSLVSLNLQKRTKELGVRKILGASLSHLAVQSGKTFLIIMCFSFLIGSLFGSMMVNMMMDSVWEYYEAINVRVIGLSVLILFTICILTIGKKITAVIVRNPSESLRYE